MCQMLVCYLGQLLCLIKYSCLIFQQKDKRVTWVLSPVTMVELGWKAVFWISNYSVDKLNIQNIHFWHYCFLYTLVEHKIQLTFIKIKVLTGVFLLNVK